MPCDEDFLVYYREIEGDELDVQEVVASEGDVDQPLSAPKGFRLGLVVGFAGTLIFVGGVLCLTIVGAPIGIPLCLIGRRWLKKEVNRLRKP
jgi:hypothetical protein